MEDSIETGFDELIPAAHPVLIRADKKNERV